MKVVKRPRAGCRKKRLGIADRKFKGVHCSLFRDKNGGASVRSIDACNRFVDADPGDWWENNSTVAGAKSYEDHLIDFSRGDWHRLARKRDNEGEFLE